jgi:hypothetical protein
MHDLSSHAKIYLEWYKKTSHAKCPECGIEVEAIPNPDWKTEDDLEVVIDLKHKETCKHAHLNSKD